MPEQDKVNRSIEADTFGRAFRARLELAELQGKKLADEYRDNVAHSLLSAGLTLIPSDHLQDHQFCVSRGVYEAAKRIVSAFLLCLTLSTLPAFAAEPSLPEGFKHWPNQQEELPIADIVRLYESGFAGCYGDKDARAELAESHADFADGSRIAIAEGFAGDGEGKLVVPFLDVLEIYPDAYPGGRQGRGDCVSWSTRNAALLTLACQAKQGRGPRPPPELASGCPKLGGDSVLSGVFSTEAIYWYRNHGGDGWSCDAAANVVSKKSGLWPRRPYPSLGVDLTTYSASTAGKYGAKEPPAEFGEYGRKHLIQSVTQVKTAEDVRDFLAQGFGISTCGSEGFSNQRNEDGVSSRSGSWMHALAYGAFDDRPETKQKYGEPLVLILNSWGPYNTGPRKIRGTEIEIPEGSFWARWSDVSRRYMVAFSGANGWQVKHKSLGAKGLLFDFKSRLKAAGRVAKREETPLGMGA